MTEPSHPLAGMKIAHLTTVDVSLEYLLLPQLLAAKEAGAEVIGISAPGPCVARLESQGIRHVALPGSTRGKDLVADLRAAGNLWRILRRERPDVLHTHNPKPGVYGRIVGRLAGVPTVVNTVHGLYATAEDRMFKRAVVYSLEAIASRFSDAELVQNQEDLTLMRRLHLAPRQRVHQLGNGVDLGWFNPNAVTESAKRSIRQDLGFDDARVVVGIVARLVHEKGYRELIRAAEATGPVVAYVAVGGQDAEKPDALTAGEMARGERAGIRFLGHREDVRDLYAAMDVVVLPSYREGIPRSLMEGAAMGKPLIASDIRGCRQVVSDGVNGRLVPARSHEELAAAIQDLAVSPVRRAEFGVASRIMAEAMFDERRVIELVLNAYAATRDRRRQGTKTALSGKVAATARPSIRPS